MTQLERLASVMVRQTYTADQLIFLEGDPAVGLWFLLDGRVKIIKQSVHGRIQGLCLMQPGKCFGSCPMFGIDTNPASAEAVDDVTLLILPRDALQNLTQHNPDIQSTS
jgi:CRP-like cAMP-binding protein